MLRIGFKKRGRVAPIGLLAEKPFQPAIQPNGPGAGEVCAEAVNSSEFVGQWRLRRLGAGLHPTVGGVGLKCCLGTLNSHPYQGGSSREAELDLVGPAGDLDGAVLGPHEEVIQDCSPPPKWNVCSRRFLCWSRAAPSHVCSKTCRPSSVISYLPSWSLSHPARTISSAVYTEQMG